MEEDKKVGNPWVIPMIFPNLPRQLYPLIPKIGDKIGTVCPSMARMIDRIRDYPKVRVLVQILSKIPLIIKVHDVEARLIDVAVEYKGFPSQCFYCKNKGHIAKKCPKKINGNVRVGKDKGKVARQENIEVNVYSRLDLASNIGCLFWNTSPKGWLRDGCYPVLLDSDLTNSRYFLDCSDTTN